MNILDLQGQRILREAKSLRSIQRNPPESKLSLMPCFWGIHMKCKGCMGEFHGFLIHQNDSKWASDRFTGNENMGMGASPTKFCQSLDFEKMNITPNQ